MLTKYAFKRGQSVAFTPEEGVILTGKIVACHIYINGFKKGGEPRPKRCAYTIEEENGTMWNADERDLVPVEEREIEKPPANTTQEEAMCENIRDRFVYDVAVRTFNVMARAGCSTVWDLILFAQQPQKKRYELRNYGYKSENDLFNWLDRNYPGWKDIGG